MRLRDVPETIGWDGALLVLRHLPEGSATVRALRPEEWSWSTRMRTNALLADVIDGQGDLAYIYAAAHTQRGKPKPRKPERYPRPWVKDESRRHLGSGAIPRCEFLKWYYGDDYPPGL